MSRMLFRGGEVFDGTKAAPAVADVLVEAGRIIDVGIDLDGDEAVDCSGGAVLPGFIDCHVHLTMTDSDVFTAAQQPFSIQFFEAARNMVKTLSGGVTTVRDAAGADQGMRVAQQRGLAPGPRIQVSLNMLSQTGGHGDPWWPSTCVVDLLPPHPGRPPVVVDGPEEVRHKVRELIRAGADVIKVATSGGVVSAGAGPKTPHFRDDEISMMVAEAEAAGSYVMAHANGQGAKAAVKNGVRSIEHGRHLDDETIAMMAERGTWLVPTLAAGHGLKDAVQTNTAYPERIRTKIQELEESGDEGIRKAMTAGVRFAMGTDAPLYPHGQNLRELELLVDSGLTSTEALHAATLSAAQLMNLDEELGSLEPGKRADIVIANGAALDVTALGDRVRSVYQDGKLVHTRDLNE